MGAILQSSSILSLNQSAVRANAHHRSASTLSGIRAFVLQHAECSVVMELLRPVDCRPHEPLPPCALKQTSTKWVDFLIDYALKASELYIPVPPKSGDRTTNRVASIGPRLTPASKVTVAQTRQPFSLFRQPRKRCCQHRRIRYRTGEIRLPRPNPPGHKRVRQCRSSPLSPRAAVISCLKEAGKTFGSTNRPTVRNSVGTNIRDTNATRLRS